MDICLGKGTFYGISKKKIEMQLQSKIPKDMKDYTDGNKYLMTD